MIGTYQNNIKEIDQDMKGDNKNAEEDNKKYEVLNQKE